ncbi:nucleotidyltransferase domain-containing protein [Niabella insulamsoli]|uniref:nucleotidyltransferase domain-containing protein n=1 Tax=Niabella insulamsoli TaxID=3144874 RepID=UPI0031FE21C4
MPDSSIILQQIKKAVLSVDPGAELILFGSRARGDHHEESDWGVLVLLNQNVNGRVKFEISDSLSPVGLENSVAISTVVVNKNNWYHKYKDYPLFFR